MTDDHTESHHQDNLPNSAPKEVAFCSRCGGTMTTKPVGDRPRRVCTECDFIYFPDPKVGVGVLVEQDNKILLVKRVMEPERGKWSLPAGFVDRGEDPRKTAVRETWQETNLRVTITDLIDVFHNPPTQGGASIFILYRARLESGIVEAGDDAADAGFFSLGDLPELAFASTHAAIHSLRDRRG